MSNLLLDSLLIENFRAFKRLEVEKLGRVNLIVGKNNVGKTALLEALWLYAARGSQHVLAEVVRRRDEVAFLYAHQRPGQRVDWIHAILSLRHGRDLALPALPLSHGESTEYGLFTIGNVSDAKRRLAFTLHSLLDGEGSWLMGVRPEEGGPLLEGFGETLSDRLGEALSAPPRRQMVSHYFISSTGLDFANHLWDDAVLAGHEDYVYEALRVIDDRIRYLNFVTGRRPVDVQLRDRDLDPIPIPVCRREGEDTPVPLRSMGEGMDRLLGLSLALVKANGGLLMVDEIESGLHYSVQPDMWRLVFETAERLNVQVFATTHSLDCIRAFQTVAEEHPEEGVLISLRRKQDAPDEIVAIEFDERGMESIVRSHIEVR